MQLLAEGIPEKKTTTQKTYRMKNQVLADDCEGPRNVEELTLNVRRTKLRFGSEESLLIVF